MIAWKLKTWRSAGAAAVLGLAACGGEGGEGGGAGGDGGEAGESGDAAISTPAEGAGATAPAGGESGEAGASSAFAGLSGAQLTALRLQHLKGFVMVAERVNAENKPAEAIVLVQQGLLEAYDAAPADFGAFDASSLRAASEGGVLTQAQLTQRLNAGKADLDHAAGALHADAAVTVARMVDIATGLYQGVVQADFVDPIEYQHSLGAALSAQAALEAHQAELQHRDRRAYSEAHEALARFVALWPQTTAPEQPTPYRDVLAQGSRVRLALSPFL